jgi:hypothetical protein
VKEPAVTVRLLALCVAAALLPPAAHAQSISLSPTDPKRWDTSVTVGWLGGNREEIAEPWNDWYDTFATSLQAGRYWTPHLKTELGVTITNDGSVYSSEQVVVPGQPRPTFFSREHRYGVRAADISAVYQAFENRWVHPFVGAGVHFAWERHRAETPFPLGPSLPAVAESTFDPLPFVSGGTKFYVGDTGFIRTDLSAALGSAGAARVWWRIGGGIDF